ncbi:cyanuric acid amidohydrolase [Tropicimonas sediminicola]|uniref:Cyclic amide hydrolase n=1 Tax=Tropicimonas sediminicola TaxID=1031541 RepID=A0A239DIY8_9RHOB|nr:cyanuric acid amidohydrolase [Tropicimonas sediminicola]
MQAKVFRLSMAHPGDLSALAALLDDGTIRAAEIVAVIGKTEGNGGVNDFTRGYFTDSLMSLLARHLNRPPEEIARTVPCILSGGTEGVLSPHYVVLCRSAESLAPSESVAALAIGAACSGDTPFETVGTADHTRAVAQSVRAAMADAGIDDPADLHFVQVKAPCLTSDRIAALQAAGLTSPAPNAGVSMARARAAGAMGVALATGEIDESELDDREFLKNFDRFSSRASISSGVEVLCNEVVVLGMSPAWNGPLRISHRVMADAIDIAAVRGVFSDLGFSGALQVGAQERDRLRAMFVKCEPDQSGQIHGARHTMLNDTDIDPQRHIRGAVGGLVAGVAGDTRIFVSGGAEHQGPFGGGLIAVIAEAAEACKEGQAQ